MKKTLKRIPIIGNLFRNVYRRLKKNHGPFPGSGLYWEKRYATGGNSGVGSYGKFAEFKATFINDFIVQNEVKSVIEFGCGDGNQLQLAQYPKYLGFDISESAIALGKELFKYDIGKEFRTMSQYRGEQADLALSLDVIYHLVENEVFEEYMSFLFGSSKRYVIIYSSNFEDEQGNYDAHVKHRFFTEWIITNHVGWSLIRHTPNPYRYKGNYEEGSLADFFIYAKR